MGIAATLIGPRRHAIGTPRLTHPVRLVDGNPSQVGRRLAAATQDGGPWRGLGGPRWITQLLHGAPPPPDVVDSLGGPAAHG
jgi:hypothetical protein